MFLLMKILLVDFDVFVVFVLLLCDEVAFDEETR